MKWIQLTYDRFQYKDSVTKLIETYFVSIKAKISRLAEQLRLSEAEHAARSQLLNSAFQLTALKAIPIRNQSFQHCTVGKQCPPLYMDLVVNVSNV